MENAKQKAIRLAYVNLIGEEKYEIIKSYIDENGIIKNDDLSNQMLFDSDDVIFSGSLHNDLRYTLKSLQGIENNNGWIKIESGFDLPSDDCECHIEFSDGSVSIDKYFTNYKMFNQNHWKHIVAYQQIVKPKKRIY